MARHQIKDEYQILGEIGSGGMATVYKAIQKSLDRPVAIKELKKAYHADDQIVRRFERESRVAASLQHENIVHIYDYWNKPTYAIVMEYVDGTNLAEVIQKSGALPIDVGIMIAIQVCSALDYAHMRGLVHRDIKPSNIMIKRNGEVKLMDFGIAHTKHLDALTLPGMLIGTPAYMSPEQILGQPLDVRSDIFSFGIVLYEILTGAKPFTDEDTRAVTAKIVKDDYPSPRRINREIPRRLQCLIRKCLRKKPKRRFESMMEVEKKLGKRLAGRTTTAASLRRIADYLVSRKLFEAAPEQETIVITGKPRMSARSRSALVAGSMLLLLGAGAGAYYQYARTVQERNALQPPPALPSASAPLVTRPQMTTALPSASAPLVTRPQTTTAPTATASPVPSGMPTATVPPLSSPAITTGPAQTSPSASVGQKKTQTTSEQKKTAASKKKKKRTLPVN
jgi:serine/threonine-protein kinase